MEVEDTDLSMMNAHKKEKLLEHVAVEYVELKSEKVCVIPSRSL